MNKKIKVLIVAFFLCIIGCALFYINGIASVSSDDEEVVVTIESGQGVSSIIETLDDAGLIKNTLCAKIFVKINSYNNLQANTYILNKNMSLNEIFSILEDPDFEYLLSTKVTIIEGMTIPDVVDAYCEAVDDASSDEFYDLLSDESYLETLIENYWFLDEEILSEDIMYSLEGYLYPETYLLSVSDLSIESFIESALDTMDVYLSDFKKAIEESDFSVHELLTLSSIVESEALYDDDKATIAGVFMNRLEIDMLLQSDVTVNYAWQKTGVDVTESELTIDSPYNTYKYYGLPIGPIGAVTSSTIEATLNYEEHDYLYFFAKEDGEVIYSETLAQHNAAIAEYKWY